MSIQPNGFTDGTLEHLHFVSLRLARFSSLCFSNLTKSSDSLVFSILASDGCLFVQRAAPILPITSSKLICSYCYTSVPLIEIFEHKPRGRIQYTIEVLTKIGIQHSKICRENLRFELVLEDEANFPIPESVSVPNTGNSTFTYIIQSTV